MACPRCKSVLVTKDGNTQLGGLRNRGVIVHGQEHWLTCHLPRSRKPQLSSRAAAYSTLVEKAASETLLVPNRLRGVGRTDDSGGPNTIWASPASFSRSKL